MRDERDGGAPESACLYLIGDINDDRAGELLPALVERRDEDLVLYINSDGGSSFHALALVNAIRAHGRVDTVCVGVALSGAADILAAGRRRYILPDSVAMLHQISWDMGQEFVANLVKNTAAIARLNTRMAEFLAMHTGKPVERLEQDMSTDHYLFGEEIIAYGLADAIYDPAAIPALQKERREHRRRPLRGGA